eukprot:3515831-Prymnesium_polylepis.1
MANMLEFILACCCTTEPSEATRTRRPSCSKKRKAPCVASLCRLNSIQCLACKPQHLENTLDRPLLATAATGGSWSTTTRERRVPRRCRSLSKDSSSFGNCAWPSVQRRRRRPIASRSLVRALRTARAGYGLSLIHISEPTRRS